MSYKMFVQFSDRDYHSSLRDYLFLIHVLVLKTLVVEADRTIPAVAQHMAKRGHSRQKTVWNARLFASNCFNTIVDNSRNCVHDFPNCETSSVCLK